MSVEDTIVASVIDKFKKRSEFGMKKYGTTLDRDDLSLTDWLNHAQEEHMDAILYLEKARKLEFERNHNHGLVEPIFKKKKINYRNIFIMSAFVIIPTLTFISFKCAYYVRRQLEIYYLFYLCTNH